MKPSDTPWTKRGLLIALSASMQLGCLAVPAFANTPIPESEVPEEQEAVSVDSMALKNGQNEEAAQTADILAADEMAENTNKIKPEEDEEDKPEEIKTGWANEGDGYGYYDQKGKPLTGLQTIEGRTYFFGRDGLSQSGWVLDDKQVWRYFQPGNYSMKTGWLLYGNAWYFFDRDGSMKTGWHNDQERWYYLSEGGQMKTGWLNKDGHWFYLNSIDGSLKTGWLTLNGSTYYLQENGVMATGKLVIDGETYSFASTGEWKDVLNQAQEQIEQILQEDRLAWENWSVSVSRLDTGETILINDRSSQSASVIKLFVAACTLENYEALSLLPGCFYYYRYLRRIFSSHKAGRRISTLAWKYFILIYFM